QTGEVKRKLIESTGNAGFESLRYMNSGASFSPDGRYLAFAAQSGGQDALYLYDVQRKKVAKKLRFDLNGISNPSWSPDSRRIVFTGLDGGLSDLFVTDLNGRLERLTRDRFADLLPAWSPDGRTIAFTTDRGGQTELETLTYGNYRVVLMDVETRAMVMPPLQEDGKNINPQWAPDSRSLVWVNDRTGTNDLYLFDREKNELHRISDLLSGIIAITPLSPVLSWARTGRLLFTYFEQAGYNVYSVDDPRTLPRFPVSRVAQPVVAETNGSSATPSPAVPVSPGSTASAADGAAAILGAASAAAERGFSRSYYRNGESFRPSATPPESRDAPAPVSVVALLDSAALALPDTIAFEHRNYKVKFTPDMIGRPTIGANVGGYYGNGLYGGSFIALSDMLGNHNIVAAANINGSISDASFFGGYNFLKRRANVGFAFSQMPLYRYFGAAYMPLEVDGETRDALTNIFRRDLIRAGQVSMSYPFSTFRRIELGATGVYYRSDVLYRGVDRLTNEPLQKDERLNSLGYVQPLAALVFDNSLFGWTGPVYGRRYRLQVSRTFGDLGFSEGLLDFRNYWNYKQKVVLASRLVGLTRIGGDADRFALFWGGPYYIRGYDGSSFDLDGNECLDSRHYDDEPSLSRCPVRDQLIGSSAAFMNVELRVPVVTELQIGFLGNFPPIDAVAFFDGGLAWDSQICTVADLTRSSECAEGLPVKVVWDRKPGQDPYLWREPLFSYGFGLRINVFYTILRLDYAFPLNRPDKSGLFSVSFGPSF
ncbi:MAG: BamA/TamA family outer membrane protein, partial [Longimicrobiales bacterium]